MQYFFHTHMYNTSIFFICYRIKSAGGRGKQNFIIICIFLANVILHCIVSLILLTKVTNYKFYIYNLCV